AAPRRAVARRRSLSANRPRAARDRGSCTHVLRLTWRHETQRQVGGRTLHVRRGPDGPGGRKPARSQRQAVLRNAASDRGAATHVGSRILVTAGNREIGRGKRAEGRPAVPSRVPLPSSQLTRAQLLDLLYWMRLTRTLAERLVALD